MPDEFPLPGSSYKELVKIIQGYGRIAGEASLGDVAKFTAMNETSISANNKFLVAIGVIKGGKKKTITPLGVELATALEHNLPEETANKWRGVVDTTDFLQKVIAAVRIRKGMDESSLESHVAYSAGQPKTPGVATGARTVVDILTAAGLLKAEGGNLIATTPEPPSIPETVQESLSISAAGEVSPRVSARSARLGSVHLNIEVTVQCTPNDLENLGTKLQKVLQDFYDEPKPEASTSLPNSAPPPPSAPPASAPNRENDAAEE
jgi:hypothetical protein